MCLSADCPRPRILETQDSVNRGSPTMSRLQTLKSALARTWTAFDHDPIGEVRELLSADPIAVGGYSPAAFGWHVDGLLQISFHRGEEPTHLIEAFDLPV